MTSYIELKNITLKAKIGCYRIEKEEPQDILVSLKLYGEFSKPEDSDDINDALDYVRVVDGVHQILNERHHTLVEHASKRICDHLFSEFPQLQRIAIKLHKPQAIKNVDRVGYFREIERNS